MTTRAPLDHPLPRRLAESRQSPSEGPAVPPSRHTRAQFIDVARGAAMLLVFVSHFGVMYFLPAGATVPQRVAFYVGLPSSPIFVMFSGMMVGMMFRERGAAFRSLRVKLMDRGLFLLVPAGVVIRAAHHWVDLGMGPGARWVFVTNTIGVSMVVVPWVLPRTSRLARAGIAVTLLALSWCAFLNWQPKAESADLVKALLFGDSRQKGAVFAFVPWLAAYLAATLAGEQLAVWRRSGRPFRRRMFGLAALFTAPAFLGHLVRKGHGPLGAALLSVGQKYPPGPAFFLAWAGLGWAILGAASWLEDTDTVPLLVKGLALLGRSSLVVFVAQYYIYYVGFFLLRLPMSPLWPLYFGVSVALNFAVAWTWDRYGDNGSLTVGLPRLVGAWEARRSLASAPPPMRERLPSRG